MAKIKFAHAHGAPRFCVMLDHMLYHANGPGDAALLSLFEKHAAAVAAHYEDCVPALDGRDYWKWSPSICPLAEFHGPQFHKGFRQWDVTPSGEDDIAIWNLLATLGEGHTSESFWNAHHHSMELTC